MVPELPDVAAPDEDELAPEEVDAVPEVLPVVEVDAMVLDDVEA